MTPGTAPHAELVASNGLDARVIRRRLAGVGANVRAVGD